MSARSTIDFALMATPHYYYCRNYTQTNSLQRHMPHTTISAANYLNQFACFFTLSDSLLAMLHHTPTSNRIIRPAYQKLDLQWPQNDHKHKYSLLEFYAKDQRKVLFEPRGCHRTAVFVPR